MAFLDNAGVAEMTAQIRSLADDTYAPKTIFKEKMYQYSATIAANTTGTVSGTDFAVSTPDGYTPVSISRVNLGTTGLVLAGLHPNATGSSSVLDVRNTTSSSKTQNITIYIMYVKSVCVS